MPQEPSWAELVRGWIEQHGYVDLALQGTALAFFLLVFLATIAGCLYWGLFLVRLSNAENVQDFTRKPIPGLRRGKLAGQEFELTEMARAESDAIRLTSETVEELDRRLEVLENAIKQLSERFEHFEDVSGRA